MSKPFMLTFPKSLHDADISCTAFETSADVFCICVDSFWPSDTAAPVFNVTFTVPSPSIAFLASANLSINF